MTLGSHREAFAPKNGKLLKSNVLSVERDVK